MFLEKIRRGFFVSAGVILLHSSLNAQDKISDFRYSRSFYEKKTFRWNQQTLPVSLILSGTALTLSSIKKDFQKNIQKGDLPVDNYIQYAPIAQLYLGDFLGMKAKNTLWNQTKYLIISELITGLITHSVKYLTDIKRPNESRYAFPSGHALQSFTGATVLYQEFKDSQAYWAYSGYAFATATAILRVTNYKHWISDVLAGAGLGMLVANLVYYFEPLKNWDPFKSKKKEHALIIVPKLQLNSYETGMGLVIQF